jgi:ketosteroid isomerase-like protein
MVIAVFSRQITVSVGHRLHVRNRMNESEIRHRFDELLEAIRAMDLDRVMSIYSADIVSFDVEPPLQHVGAAAKRKNWAHVFSMHQRPLQYEIRDLAVAVNDDVAFGHGFVRIGGTLKNGQRMERWLRATTCFRKVGGNWLIVHDQVSVPLDMESGRAVLDLEP